jgi:hypothetical protein
MSASPRALDYKRHMRSCLQAFPRRLKSSARTASPLRVSDHPRPLGNSWPVILIPVCRLHACPRHASAITRHMSHPLPSPEDYSFSPANSPLLWSSCIWDRRIGGVKVGCRTGQSPRLARLGPISPPLRVLSYRLPSITQISAHRSVNPALKLPYGVSMHSTLNRGNLKG